MEIVALCIAVGVPAALVLGFRYGVALMRDLNREFNDDLSRRLGEDNTYDIR